MKSDIYLSLQAAQQYSKAELFIPHEIHFIIQYLHSKIDHAICHYWVFMYDNEIAQVTVSFLCICTILNNSSIEKRMLRVFVEILNAHNVFKTQ